MCDCTAFWPSAVRPALTTSTGLPAARAARNRRRKRAPSLMPSTYSAITSVLASPIAYSRKSHTSRSAWLPSDTQKLKPVPRSYARDSMAPASAPLWLMSAILPLISWSLRISACAFSKHRSFWLLK